MTIRAQLWRRGLVVALCGVLCSIAAVLVAEDTHNAPEGQAGPAGVFAMPDSMGDSLFSPGGTLFVIFRCSGVTDDGEQGSGNRKEATSIHCTNFGSVDADVEVQVYQWNGTDVYVGSATLPAGRTDTFSTQNTTIYFDDVIIGGVPGTPAIFQGSALVLSDSHEVVCTGQVLDPLNYPPVYLGGLELYR